MKAEALMIALDLTMRLCPLFKFLSLLHALISLSDCLESFDSTLKSICEKILINKPSDFYYSNPIRRPLFNQ